MSIIRTHKQRSFAVIDHEPIDDARLSWEALGLLTYLLSKPDDWTLHVDHLIEMERGAGRDKVYRILKEMEDAGYLVRRRERRSDGTFEWVRELYECPQAVTAPADPQGEPERPITPVPALLLAELAKVPCLAEETSTGSESSPLPALPYMAEPDTAEPDTAKPDILLNTELPNIIIDLDAGGVGKRLSAPIRQAFEQHCGLIASPLLEERMKAAEAQYPQEWILRAIELAGAGGRGKNNWHYIAGILENWKREGMQAAKPGTPRSHNGAGPPKPKRDGRSPLLVNDPNATGVTATVIDL